MARPTKYRHPVAISRDRMAQIGPTSFQPRGIRFAEGEGGAGSTPPAEATPPAPQPPAPTPPAQPTPPAPIDYRGNP